MSNAKPSAEDKKVAKHASAAFGGSPSVAEYLHDTESLSVDILSCENRPCDGVTSYSTIGLSRFPMFAENQPELSIRLELAGACASQSDLYANVMASVAFCVMQTKKMYMPGSIMQKYVSEYCQFTTVPHLYFTAPFLWEDSLTSLDLGGESVVWLLLVPISDSELHFLFQHGDDALESLFEEEQIDIFDLSRMPVV
ncbi:suppressor of fused domain protein [Bremerella sp. T1]|uniref:suppressor of fused domain protein n=1 Tax=Bremerella sp. TYQ1 TaxID=3119568 RepID=UPI001CCA246A|nr:suppressor of fused domain protein [Bremerella volcania]UBM36766.1 suppressor of fused domain protein [Bremerella volcania]